MPIVMTAAKLAANLWATFITVVGECIDYLQKFLCVYIDQRIAVGAKGFTV
jgi:hypothetical protein